MTVDLFRRVISDEKQSKSKKVHELNVLPEKLFEFYTAFRLAFMLFRFEIEIHRNDIGLCAEV